MNSPNWERLHILSVLLDSTSLSEAARKLGKSQPTVSRQIRVLEAELGAPLVDVTPEGAFPTEAALALAPRLDDMRAAAGALGPEIATRRGRETVRIACGPWMSLFLNRHVGALLGEPADLVVETASSVAFADLPRREAEIAIRNSRPTNERLVVRRLPDYGCAAYGHVDLVRDRPQAFDARRFTAFDWAALAPELAHFPTARWLAGQCRSEPVIRCSTSVNLLDAVLSGRVLAVLPCFAADGDARLRRVAPPFVPDYDGHWLVMADDVRRRPHVRRAADRIVALLEARRDALRPAG